MSSEFASELELLQAMYADELAPLAPAAPLSRGFRLRLAEGASSLTSKHVGCAIAAADTGCCA